MEQRDQWILLCTLLSIMYGTLCILCGIQLFRILYYRHNLKSFHFAFLLLCFCWTLLRVIFFAETEYLQFWLVLVLFWTPLDFQFATFSLLVVFYVYLLYKREWTHKKRWVFALYGISVVSMFVLTGVYIVIGDRMGVESIHTLEKAHHLYMACQLTILTVLYAYYGYQLNVVNSVPYFEVSDGSGSGGRPMVAITALGFLIFLSRAVYVFCAAFNIGTIELGGNNGGLKTPNVAALFSFLWWEILPTLTVLIYFRKIPKTRVRACPWLPCCAHMRDSGSANHHTSSPPQLPGVSNGSDIGDTDGAADPYQEPFAQYDDPEALDPALLQTGVAVGVGVGMSGAVPGVGVGSGMVVGGSDGLFVQPTRYDTDDDLASPPVGGGGAGGSGSGRIVNPSSVDVVTPHIGSNK